MVLRADVESDGSARLPLPPGAMRTILNLNDDLLRRARRRAASEGVSLSAVVERALRSYLKGGPPNSDYRLRWRPEHGRPRPGIRVADRDALFELMEDGIDGVGLRFRLFSGNPDPQSADS